MQYIKHLVAFALVLVVSAVGSVAKLPKDSKNTEMKTEIETRLSTAANQISNASKDKPEAQSDRFSQWYNWNNWSNWSNWRNW